MDGVGWREIARILRARIESGEYPPGHRLDTETALAEQFGVTRNIARIALAELVADGLLVRRRRLGTFVRDREPVRVPFSVYQRSGDPARDGAHLGPWETACAEIGVDGRTEVVGVRETDAPAQIAHRLRVEPGAPLVCRARHLWAGDRVAQIQATYMPAALVAGTVLAGPSKIVGGAYAAFTTAGMVPTTASIEAVARMPTGDERETLGLALGVPVLETWRTTWDQHGRAIEVLHCVAAAEAARLIIDELPLR